MLFGSTQYNPPSRFLDEIPSDWSRPSRATADPAGRAPGPTRPEPPRRSRAGARARAAQPGVLRAAPAQPRAHRRTGARRRPGGLAAGGAVRAGSAAAVGERSAAGARLGPEAAGVPRRRSGSATTSSTASGAKASCSTSGQRRQDRDHRELPRRSARRCCCWRGRPSSGLDAGRVRDQLTDRASITNTSVSLAAIAGGEPCGP